MIKYLTRRYGVSMNRLFLTMFGLFAYGILLANDPILIPFREGKQWGLITENKKWVVDAKYQQIQFQQPYFFCVDIKQSRYDIFSWQGKYIDTCHFFDSIDSRHYILRKNSRAKFEGNVTIAD